MLSCLTCANTFPGSEPRWRCSRGGRLKLKAASFFTPDCVAGRSARLWRYREALGLDDPANCVTLGEGLTPLVPVPIEGRQVLMKLDFLCPTGSCKDRGSTVMVSKLKEWGVTEILEDSSGNAGASIAAYAAAAGMRARIYIP